LAIIPEQFAKGAFKVPIDFAAAADHAVPLRIRCIMPEPTPQFDNRPLAPHNERGR